MTDRTKQFEQQCETARRESPPVIDVTAAIVARIAAGPTEAAGTSIGNLNLRRRAARWTMVVTVCVIAVWLGWVAQTGTNQALAAVQLARQTLSEPTDRTYTITVDGQSPRGAAHSRQATLYARGTDQFVFKIKGPFGTDIIAGSNGKKSWLIHPIGPVLVSTDASNVDRWLSREVPIPVLRLDEILQRLELKYDLSIVASGTNPMRNAEQHLSDNISPNAESVHVVGHRYQDEPIVPDTVEVWVDRSTGILQRLELRWSGSIVRPGPRYITAILKGDEPLEADFFQSQPTPRESRLCPQSRCRRSSITLRPATVEVREVMPTQLTPVFVDRSLEN